MTDPTALARKYIEACAKAVESERRDYAGCSDNCDCDACTVCRNVLIEFRDPEFVARLSALDPAALAASEPAPVPEDVRAMAEEALRLDAEASAAPWEQDEDTIEGANGGAVCHIAEHKSMRTIKARGESYSSADARFIARSRTLLPALARAVLATKGAPAPDTTRLKLALSLAVRRWNELRRASGIAIDNNCEVCRAFYGVDPGQCMCDAIGPTR